MFCRQCGAKLSDSAAFCQSCGTAAGKTAGAPASAQPAHRPGMVALPTQITFQSAVSTCLSKFATFKGRATRPEFWWFYLFTLLVNMGMTILQKFAGDGLAIPSLVVSIGIGIPSLAAATRRLHDTDRSGWWQLLWITIIGIIPLVIWLASKGDPQENRFGPPA